MFGGGEEGAPGEGGGAVRGNFWGEEGRELRGRRQGCCAGIHLYVHVGPAEVSDVVRLGGAWV